MGWGVDTMQRRARAQPPKARARSAAASKNYPYLRTSLYHFPKTSWDSSESLETERNYIMMDKVQAGVACSFRSSEKA